MAIHEKHDQAWTRKHDKPGEFHVPSAPATLYPESECLKDLLDRCKHRPANQRMRAAGSHWALSDAAVSDHTFVETHDPNNAFPAMGRTLYDVIPECMTQAFIDHLAARQVAPYDGYHVNPNEGLYPVHIETGKRIYQLYSELDFGDQHESRSLASLLEKEKHNASYRGPWAFHTLGGAGGQTVFGALTTGTHGGDFLMPPIADAVMAMHLVADGGKHYWIEPESTGGLPPLTDDHKLQALYGPVSGDPGDFEILRDDEMFNAVLVSVGRFGIVYSVVLKAVRQYSLREESRLVDSAGEPLTWQDVRGVIGTPAGPFYLRPTDTAKNGLKDNRFLQVAVCLTPFDNFTKNRVSVTKRWNIPLAGTSPAKPFGRDERRGDPPIGRDNKPIIDPAIASPRFPMAGNSHAYSGEDPGFLSRACADANFMQGLIEALHDELEQLLHDNILLAAGAVRWVAMIGGTEALAPLLPYLVALLLLLKHLLDELARNNPRQGQAMELIRNLLLGRSDPNEKCLGLCIWHCIAYKIFEAVQYNGERDAISYAMMDRHDYLSQSCDVNVDSIEVFFAADDPMLVAFIDKLITFEIQQEAEGKAFLGYASLRFTGPTRALIGMQTAPVMCAVEVAGLLDVNGTSQLINHAIALARNPNFNGILHWGQRNDFTMADVQARFGDRPSSPTGRLRQWRHALSRITDNGRLDGFSSAFTKLVGLEIVSPTMGSVTIQPPTTTLGSPVSIVWKCPQNPPSLEVEIEIVFPSSFRTTTSHLPASGFMQFSPPQRGTFVIRVSAVLVIQGETRSAERTLNLVVT